MSYSVLVWYETLDSNGKTFSSGNATIDVENATTGVAKDLLEIITERVLKKELNVKTVVIKHCTIFPHG